MKLILAPSNELELNIPIEGTEAHGKLVLTIAPVIIELPVPKGNTFSKTDW